MSIVKKLMNSLKELFWTALYFFIWIGSFSYIKFLLLKEYSIEFYPLAIVITGTFIAAKAVHLLEHVHLPWVRKQPAIFAILLRTFLYMAGAVFLLLLHEAIEERHEYGGVFKALAHSSYYNNIYHIAVNAIGVFGCMFFFNLWSVLKLHYGDHWFLNVLFTPIPDKTNKK